MRERTEVSEVSKVTSNEIKQNVPKQQNGCHLELFDTGAKRSDVELR